MVSRSMCLSPSSQGAATNKSVARSASDLNPTIDVVNEILRWLLYTIATGAVLVPVFKWLGQKLIEQRLAIRLEKFKSEQERELEKLRHLLSSRVSRIHEKEFEVLPKAWFLLNDAAANAHHLMAALKQYPDFATLPEPRFEEFLKGSRLSDSQKEELRQSSDRTKLYAETIFWIELEDALTAQGAFHNYLVENRIFMTDELREKFGAVDNDLADALIEHRNGKRFANASLFDSSLEKVTALPEKIKQVDEAVQKRLHYEDA
jgi:hypothetical protein